MTIIAERYRDQILGYLRVQSVPDLDAAVRETREHFSPFGAIDETLLVQVRDDIESELRQRIRQVSDPYILSRRTRWYDEGAQEEGIHWPALAAYLAREKDWGDDVVRSVSRSSARVVGELGNPAETGFDVRGLVVGYVQSGKTANMTAVIARAVDAGYNLVVVLAGTTDKLRDQTQIRLENDLIHRNPYNWQPLTSRNEYDVDGNVTTSGDYRGENSRKLPRLAPNVTMICVIKKLPAQLRRLTGDIRNSPGPLCNRLRMLVIDDEADQASPNAARTDELPSTTNRCIRELLHALPTVSYVGYTATPYANILINPFPAGVTTEDEQSLEDLYPRDFIVALPRPEGYFGPEEIFGRDPVDAECEGADGLDVIRHVDDAETSQLSPPHSALTLDAVPSLRKAIRWFILSVAARLVRGQGGQHASMLLHTSHRIDDHSDIQRVVEPEIEFLVSSIEDTALLTELCSLWNEESAGVPASEFGNTPVTFEEIIPYLPETLSRLRVAVENSQSEDRLSYSGPPMAVIAIGGNILARGLTLEGLTVTYFIRRPRQYDTLLQMGRWFGYRGGYEDLVRLWMPEEVSDAFRQLALVEHELREEIEEYAERRARPIDFAVRIRTLPGLQVTARSKMRHARTANIDYRGMHLQTIRFPRLDQATLESNWEAGSQLVARSDITDSGSFGLVDHHAVVDFFRSYSVHPSHRDLSSGWLEQYIRENASVLGEWSVGIIQPADTRRPVAEKPLGPVMPRLVRRSRLEDTDDDIADIKALMSRADVFFDVQEGSRPDTPDWRNWEWARLKNWRETHVAPRPMILLYPIDRVSPPVERGENGKRVALEASHDVLGVGLVFPQLGVEAGRSPTRYIQIDLSRGDFGDEDPEEPETPDV